MKSIFKLALAILVFLIAACSEDSEGPTAVNKKEEAVSFEGWKVDSLNNQEFTIYISPEKKSDTVVVKDLSLLHGASIYLALDADRVDPEIDFNAPVEEGTKIAFVDTTSFSLVVLDEDQVVISVWLVKYLKPVASSSSAADSTVSSSSVNDTSVVSSSSVNDTSAASSSSVNDTSVVSSSSVNDTSVVSSSSVNDSTTASSSSTQSSSSVESSSSDAASSSSNVSSSASSSSGESNEESSSSEEQSSSSEETPTAVALGDFEIDGATLTVSENKIYAEVPYGTDVSKLLAKPMNDTMDFSRPVEMEFLDAGNVKAFTVVAGVQLPGSDFNNREDSFWGTTSDAMDTKVKVSGITMASSANLSVESGKIILESKIVSGSSLGISAGKKLAGGFYFAGSYDGIDCNDIYNSDGGYPGLESSNLTEKMQYGQPFNARPKSFEVTYAYNHKSNKDSDHPQMSLIYVLLVSGDNKIVASGMITDSESREMGTTTVEFSYGEPPSELIDDSFAVQKGLEVGDGTEDVAFIHVMFASSAHAHVVANGESSFRGGAGSQLIIDDFKLVY